VSRPVDTELRIARLERSLARHRAGLAAIGLVAIGLVVAGFAPGRPDVIEAHAIRIVDAAGKPRILIGAPPPAEGRERQDGQTASIVVLDDKGRDRLILGEEPNPRLGGKSYPRVAGAYGLVLHDQTGSERGAMSWLDNGRGVIALDRSGGDAVAMIVNEKSGFAGFTVNYANPVGKYAEGIRLGTKGDTAWLSLEDRADGERARLAVEGAEAPKLITRPAGAPPAP
jgi:hypothetical protein